MSLKFVKSILLINVAMSSKREYIIATDTLKKVSLYFSGAVVLVAILVFVRVWGSAKWNEFTFLIEEAINGNLSPIFFHIILPLFLGFLMHEIIHAVTFAFFSKNKFRSIQFGYKKDPAMIFVHCKDPIPVWGYPIGVIMSLIFLGLFPLILGLWAGSLLVTFFGILLTSAAIGDLLILQSTRGLSADTMIQDNPEKIGFKTI